jgi:hypothetical protein
MPALLRKISGVGDSRVRQFLRLRIKDDEAFVLVVQLAEPHAVWEPNGRSPRTVTSIGQPGFCLRLNRLSAARSQKTAPHRRVNIALRTFAGAAAAEK